MRAAVLAAAAIAGSIVAIQPAAAYPPVITDPSKCAQFYPNANCQNLGPGNPYTGSGYRSHNVRNSYGQVRRRHHR